MRAAEAKALRERVTTAEKRILHLEKTIVEKDKYITGLEGQLRQITASSATILTANHASDDIAEAAQRSDKAKGRKR